MYLTSFSSSSGDHSPLFTFCLLQHVWCPIFNKQTQITTVTLTDSTNKQQVKQNEAGREEGFYSMEIHSIEFSLCGNRSEGMSYIEDALGNWALHYIFFFGLEQYILTM